MFFRSTSNEMYRDITIPGIFFDLFMPIATGPQLKVFLLGYKSAVIHNGLGGDGLDNEKIGNTIGLREDEVEAAWEYWEKMEIVKIHRVDGKMSVEFLDMKDHCVTNNVMKKPEVVNITEISETSSSPDFIKMFSLMESTTGRVLNPNEKMKIITILENLKYSPEIMERAFLYEVEKDGKFKSIASLERRLNRWHDNKVETVDEAEMYEQSFKDRYYQYTTVFKALGFNRTPGAAEKEFMDKWFDEYNMPMEVVLKACEKIVNVSNPTLKYFHKIVTNWYEDGVRTLEDVERQEQEREKTEETRKKNKTKTKDGYKRKKEVAPSLKTRFHNFEESSRRDYSDEELNSFITNRKK